MLADRGSHEDLITSKSQGRVEERDLQLNFKVTQGHPRLNFSRSGEDELCISNEMLSRIWWPDTFFANAKMASFHGATTHNAFLRIKPTGFITQSLR